MSFRKSSSKYNHTVMIKRAIEVDDTLKKWIFSNSNYRRKVWNDFVAEYKKCVEDQRMFDVVKYQTWYFNNIETPNKEYDTHTSGISEQVMKDMLHALKISKLKHGQPHFRKFDPFRCSFGVYCKPYFRELKVLPPRFHSKTFLVSDYDYDFIEYRDSGGDKMYIKLKESLIQYADEIDGTFYFVDRNYHYAFTQEDVKTISFIHEMGKFYVCLGINVIRLYSRKHRENYRRKGVAGIDLGIHNPVCISDESGFYIERMSDKEMRRIHYLERVAKRRQSVMDRKTYGSNNYNKIRRKFRISWYKIRNIRKNWRRQLSKRIATSYKKICVDPVQIPSNSDHLKTLNKYAVRKINAYNRFHGMFLFNEALKHACWKYGTEYIEAPNNTTCTCSRCGHINNHLSLSERIFRCISCDFTVDRDINAAQNCYAYIA